MGLQGHVTVDISGQNMQSDLRSDMLSGSDLDQIETIKCGLEHLDLLLDTLPPRSSRWNDCTLKGADLLTFTGHTIVLNEWSLLLTAGGPERP